MSASNFIPNNAFRNGLIQLQAQRLKELYHYWAQHLFKLQTTKEYSLQYTEINIANMREFVELIDKLKNAPLPPFPPLRIKIINIVKAAWDNYQKMQCIANAKKEAQIVNQALNFHVFNILNNLNIHAELAAAAKYCAQPAPAKPKHHQLMEGLKLATDEAAEPMLVTPPTPPASPVEVQMKPVAPNQPNDTVLMLQTPRTVSAPIVLPHSPSPKFTLVLEANNGSQGNFSVRQYSPGHFKTAMIKTPTVAYNPFTHKKFKS